MIDVWWSARANGSMMITLAYLMQSNRPWRDARLEGEPVIVVPKLPPLVVIASKNERSAVTFVGVSVRALEEAAGPLSSYSPLVDGLQGHLFLTKNWHDLEL